MFNPRSGQRDVVNYSDGKMGVSAVPGSGKTQTLSFLAAKLVASDQLKDDQEVLIVTLVNSAVDNFSSRVAQFLRQSNLIPGIGYRVRTLHGLAYDIVREHPDLIGLDNHFSIADERTCEEILTICVDAWMKSNQEFLQKYSDINNPYQKHQYDWLNLLRSFGASFIRQAKDLRYSADELRLIINQEGTALPLLELGSELYLDYQNSLLNRGAVDFEDLIRFALKILTNYPDVLEKLRYRWPYILEDEAQDSSLIQEQLLRLISGEGGNWVRVGDTNQAIFETFTTANPQLLRDFIKEADVMECKMRYSGRSTKSIIELANRLILWTNQYHPVEQLKEALTEPLIEPTPANDPQQNPADEPMEVYLFNKAFKPDQEIKVVAKSLQNWLESNPEKTVAVLVPRNTRGAALADELTAHNIPFIELLKSSKSTRDTARILKEILDFYASPNSIKTYNQALAAIFKAGGSYDQNKQAYNAFFRDLAKWGTPEKLFSGTTSLNSFMIDFSIPDIIKESVFFALEYLARWQKTVLLPIDQMIMTISMEIFQEAAELALSHKLAVILKAASRLYPEWELPDFCGELDSIAKNRFRLYGFSEEDLSFEPDRHKGKVVISTIHKAKGLEWDRVYLMSVNNYDFPSVQENDQYISEKWFVRGRINLEAEALSQLKALNAKDRISLHLPEGDTTLNARMDYAAERLRLFFVGLTRAKSQLVVTWNTGRNSDCREALPLEALRLWREEQYARIE